MDEAFSHLSPEELKALLLRELQDRNMFGSSGLRRSELRPVQKEILRKIRESTSRTFVVNCTRRLGKSYLLGSLAIDTAISAPDLYIKYAAPTTKDLKKIILPIFKQITSQIPEHFKPTFDKSDSIFKFQNGSEIHIAGVNNGHSDDLRGQAADLGIIDEAGFIDELQYLIDSVMVPMFVGRKKDHIRGKIIIASTPPESPAHYFTTLIKQAIVDGNYIHKTIYESNFSPEEIKEIEETYKNKKSAFRREFMAEIVIDEELAIIPEFIQTKEKVVTPCEPPEYYYPFVVGDLGFINDLSAVLFGWYDFTRGKICIRSEVQSKSSTTKDLVSMCKKIEKKVFQGAKQNIMRYIDADPRIISDMGGELSYIASTIPRLAIEARVNKARIDLELEKIEIHPDCENLIRHLEYGVWKSNKADFQRIEGYGHFDFVAAFVYFLDLIDRRSNPYPKHYGLDRESQYIPSSSDEPYAPKRSTEEITSTSNFIRSLKSLQKRSFR